MTQLCPTNLPTQVVRPVHDATQTHIKALKGGGKVHSLQRYRLGLLAAANAESGESVSSLGRGQGYGDH